MYCGQINNKNWLNVHMKNFWGQILADGYCAETFNGKVSWGKGPLLLTTPFQVKSTL